MLSWMQVSALRRHPVSFQSALGARGVQRNSGVSDSGLREHACPRLIIEVEEGFREGYVEEYQSDLKNYAGKNRKEGRRQR